MIIGGILLVIKFAWELIGIGLFLTSV